MTEALRAVYRYWVGVVFLAVLAQIAAAGYGAFYSADKLGDQSGSDESKMISEKTFDGGFDFHNGFGYLIFLATVVLLLVALGARIGRPRIWWILAVPILTAIQIILAWAGEDVPFVGSFHPVNAIIIAGLTGFLASQEWRRRALERDVASTGSVATPR
jgi:Family of unknown function (DUF6220)